MRISPNNSSLRRSWEVRLATTVTIAELHGLMNVEFRRNHEAEHEGAEAEAPEGSRPAWPFLRNSTFIRQCISSRRIYWCRFRCSAPRRAREKAEKPFDLG